MEVEPIGQRAKRGHTTTRSGQIVLEAEKLKSSMSGKPSVVEPRFYY